MKAPMNPEKFVNLLGKGLSLDLIYLLRLFEQKVELSEIRSKSVKFDTLCHSLLRKGLVTEDGALTLSGIELLVFIDNKDAVKLVRKKADGDLFDNWWKAYPGTNKFTYKGKTFAGTRAMRVKQEECKLKFYAILNEGDYTAQQLIGALNMEVLMKKEDSIKKRENQLTFMQNSLTYLNQRSYEPFIELIESPDGCKNPLETKQSFDIQDYDGVNI